MDMQDRITVFEQMLADDPDNTMVMFGLAKEYEKAGRNDDVIAILERYLAAADDEGNAYGVLANAYARIGKPDKAVEAYKKGIDVSLAHGHPSMASDYKMTLDMDYGDEI
jgi:predicted Zn-dependent protease